MISLATKFCGPFALENAGVDDKVLIAEVHVVELQLVELQLFGLYMDFITSI